MKKNVNDNLPYTKMVMTSSSLRTVQLLWGYFIGLGAYCGGIVMLLNPSGKWLGMAPMLPYFQALPFADLLFQNFTVPGIALLLCNGVTNSISVALIHSRHPLAPLSGIACGVILMLWIVVQFCIFELNIISTLYFIFGLMQVANGLVWRHKQPNARKIIE